MKKVVLQGKSGSSKCVLVLGMHRSGTSALTGILQMLGFALGNNPMPANDFNEKGYFEDLDICNLNDRILSAFGRRWDSVKPFTPAENDFFKSEVKKLYYSKFANTRLFCIKDPRLSLTLPFWLTSLQEVGVHCSVVIAVRNPLQVAASLGRRDGFSLPKSLILWASYLINAEQHSRHRAERVLVNYETLLNSPNACLREIFEAADIDINLDDKLLKSVGKFLDPRLAHHKRVRLKVPPGLDWIQRFYESVQAKGLDKAAFSQATVVFNSSLAATYAADLATTISADTHTTKSTLYIDSGKGYSEQSKVHSTLGLYKSDFFVHFNSFDSVSKIASLRWDPIEGRLIKLQIDSCIVTDQKGEKHVFSAEQLKFNGIKSSNGVVDYHTTDPRVELPVNFPVRDVMITGNLWPLDPAGIVNTLKQQITTKMKDIELVENTNQKHIQEKIAWLNEAKTQMGEANKMLKEKNQLVSDKDRLIGEKELMVTTRESLLAEKEQWLSEVKHMIKERDELMSAARTMVEEKEKFLAEKEHMLSERANLISENNRILFEKTKLIDDLKKSERMVEEANAKTLSLFNDKMGLLAEISSLKALEAKLLRENDEWQHKFALETEKSNHRLVLEKGEWLAERAALLGEKELLITERNALMEDKDRIAELAKETDDLRREREALTMERDGLVSERNELTGQNQDLVAENEALKNRQEEEKNELLRRRQEEKTATDSLLRQLHILNTEKARLVQDVSNMRREIAKKNEELAAVSRTLKETSKGLNDQRNRAEKAANTIINLNRKLNSEGKAFAAKISGTETKMAELNDELAYYKKFYLEVPVSATNIWARRILYRLDRFFPRETYLPESRLLDPVVFDPIYYQDANPHLRSIIEGDRKKAQEHWLQQGVLEGLPSCRLFHVRYYLDQHPDLKKYFKKDFKGAIKHWLDAGLREGRSSSPEFDVRVYQARYGDLRTAFGHDFEKIALHWLNHGAQEGRDASPDQVAMKTLNNGQVQSARAGIILKKLSENGKPDKPVVIYESHNMKLQGAPNSLFEIASGTKHRQKFHPLAMSNSKGPMVEVYKKEGIGFLCHGVSQQRLRDNGGPVKAIELLSEVYKQSGASLVHVNTLQNFHSILAAHKAGIPSVWNIRESEHPDTYYDYLPEDLRKLAYSAFEKTDAVIFVAEATRKLWNHRLEGVVENRTILNGIDISRLMHFVYGTNRAATRASLGISPEDIVLLNVGTVTSRKGQMDLVEAMKVLDPTVRKRIVLAIAGFNESDYSREVEEKLNHLREAGLRTIFVPESSSIEERRKVAELYLASDIFVLTSRVESYPRVILEAMEFGLSIVTTPCFGVKEQLREGEHALFYDEGNVVMLCSHISTLINHPDKRKHFGEQGRRRLQELNSYDQMLASYEAVYSRVLEKVSAGARLKSA